MRRQKIAEATICHRLFDSIQTLDETFWRRSSSRLVDRMVKGESSNKGTSGSFPVPLRDIFSWGSFSSVTRLSGAFTRPFLLFCFVGSLHLLTPNAPSCDIVSPIFF